MKIVLVSPLFPPDTAPVARYAKELAARLAKKHAVTAVIYGHLPEQVPGVQFVTVDKRHSRLRRLFRYIRVLFANVSSANIVLLINGPSVELPVFLVSSFSNIPIISLLADASALQRTNTHWFPHAIKRMLHPHVRIELHADAMPKEKPEILPFAPVSDADMRAYEDSWNEHVALLEQQCNTHART